MIYILKNALYQTKYKEICHYLVLYTDLGSREYFGFWRRLVWLVIEFC